MTFGAPGNGVACGADHRRDTDQAKEPVWRKETGPVLKPRSRRAPPLGLALDPSSPEPLHRQIGEQMRRAILERRLKPGARLPSSRQMAAGSRLRARHGRAGLRPARRRGLCREPGRLGHVGRGQPARRDAGRASATGARLQGHGRRQARRGAPDRARCWPRPHRRVSAGLPWPFPPASRTARRFLCPVGQAAGARMAPARRARRRAPCIHSAMPACARRSPPISAWRAASPAIRRRRRHDGHAPRASRCSRAGRARCAATPPGSRSRASSARARRWPTAEVSAPCRCRSTRQGFSPERRGAAAPTAARSPSWRPSHQFPLGTVLSLQRRLELLSWAERTGGWIAEDDFDGEYRYAGRPLRAAARPRSCRPRRLPQQLLQAALPGAAAELPRPAGLARSMPPSGSWTASRCAHRCWGKAPWRASSPRATSRRASAAHAAALCRPPAGGAARRPQSAAFEGTARDGHAASARPRASGSVHAPAAHADDRRHDFDDHAVAAAASTTRRDRLTAVGLCAGRMKRQRPDSSGYAGTPEADRSRPQAGHGRGDHGRRESFRTANHFPRHSRCVWAGGHGEHRSRRPISTKPGHYEVDGRHAGHRACRRPRGRWGAARYACRSGPWKP